MLANSRKCECCADNGIERAATVSAPSSTNGIKWDWTNVCAYHAEHWWDGSDWPDGEGAPAPIQYS